MNKRDITYCPTCNDGWSDENFMLGICCGKPLQSRKETDEEYNLRIKAQEAIKNRVKYYKETTNET